MKKASLVTTVLATALMANLVLPAVANAAAHNENKSEGNVTFVEDKETVNPPVDPEFPGEIIEPPYKPNPNKDSLMIDGATNLEFKKQAAIMVDKHYFAEQVTVKVDGKEKGVRGNYMQFTDKRAKGDDNPAYTISVSMEKPFTAAKAGELVGATIDFTNLNLESATDKALSKWPKLLSTAFTLNSSGSKVEVLQSEKGHGFGTYTLEFGNTPEYHVNTGNGTVEDSTGKPNDTDANLIENGSVSLFVPGKSVKTDELYTATILWQIDVTP